VGAPGDLEQSLWIYVICIYKNENEEKDWQTTLRIEKKRAYYLYLTLDQAQKFVENKLHILRPNPMAHSMTPLSKVLIDVTSTEYHLKFTLTFPRKMKTK